MAVYLSNTPPTFDGKDVFGYLKRLSAYVTGVHEELDVEIGRIRKTESETQDRLSGIEGNIRSILEKMRSLDKRISELEGG